MPRHQCFISYKREDLDYKMEVQRILQNTAIDKSLDEPINSNDPDYILRAIRKNYLSTSTVTIFLIGTKSAENLGWDEQQYIKRELQASLYNAEGNNRSGILGVVLPEMEYEIFRPGQYLLCTDHNRSILYPFINDNSVIREFRHNYNMVKSSKCICEQSNKDKYCVLTPWSKFINDPDFYIDWAFQNKDSEAAKNVVVFPQ